MERDKFLEKVSGSLLGLAVGDALGMPANGLVPFEVNSRFQYIDGFYPGTSLPAGAHTGVTNSALLAAAALIGAASAAEVFSKYAHSMRPGSLDDDTKDAILKGMPSESLDGWFLSRLVPVGVAVAAKNLNQSDHIDLCKTMVGFSHKRKLAMLAGFVVSSVVMEMSTNAAELSATDLYDKEGSLLDRLVNMSERAERGFENEPEKLWQRLLYVRRGLQRGAKHAEIIGLNGNSANILESVPFSLFCFLNSPDSFDCVNRAASMGRAASLNASLTGAFVGAYLGSAPIREDLRDGVQNSGRIREAGKRLVDAVWVEKAV